MRDICVAAEKEETALEVLLRHIPAAPAGYLRQLLQKGKVCRQGAPLSAGAPVQPGDRLQLPESARLRELLDASAVTPTILFESREILVADKPSGLAIHRGQGHEDNLTDRLQKLIRLRKARYSVAPVHRLDAATSGAVVFGKGREATAALGRIFMAGGVEKSYLALAAGRTDASGQIVTPVHAKGKWKAARTDFHRLAVYGDFSLLELHLHSGRTHQIRLHLAGTGHPLAGDQRYHGPQPKGLKRLFLHCSRLALTNPFDGRHLVIESPLPAELNAFLTTLHRDTDA